MADLELDAVAFTQVGDALAVGRAIAMAWDPKTDGSCKAFGAAAVMRMPTRVRISWADDTTLEIETEYLLGRLVTSSHFRREPDASKWSPKPCKPVLGSRSNENMFAVVTQQRSDYSDGG